MRPRTSRVRDALVFATGFLPLLAWELFALLYYGFPFPNTAYAKLKTGIPEPELIRQGFIYLIDSIQRDPLTLLAIISTAAWSVFENPRRTRPIALGVLCYVAYVTWVGGDFMSGRMLEAPLLAAVIVLIVADVAALTEPRWALLVFAGVVGVNASQAAFGRSLAQPSEALSESGVADERLYWFAGSGLMNYTRDVPWPKSSQNGLQARTEGPRVVVNVVNGVLGYFAGPRLHIVDIMGLGDPLLARLPALSSWRIGHFERAVPLGYGDPETVATQMIGPKMTAYYQRLSLITKGPLWDRKRLATIVQMNVGRYDDLLHEAATEATYSVHPTYRTGDRIPARGAGRWQCTTTRDVKPLTAGDLLPVCPGDWIWLGR
jgi:arabinofuranosyltransferase